MSGAEIIIAEDHLDTRDLYADALAIAGFKVHLATSAASIVQLVRRYAIDVVIMDLSLTGARIEDVLGALRAAGRGPQLIAVTGRSPEGEPWESAFAKYLVKPVMPDALVAAVVDVLRS